MYHYLLLDTTKCCNGQISVLLLYDKGFTCNDAIEDRSKMLLVFYLYFKQLSHRFQLTWRHVSTVENPADLGSRGAVSKQLDDL